MSGWMVSLINECLAEGNLGHTPAFMHLLGLVPSEFRTQEGSIVRHTKKEPKSLRPAFAVIIDELLLAYHYGLPMEDGSLAKDAHRRKFRCNYSLSVSCFMHRMIGLCIICGFMPNTIFLMHKLNDFMRENFTYLCFMHKSYILCIEYNIVTV